MLEFEYLIIHPEDNTELSMSNYDHAMQDRVCDNGYLCEVRIKMSVNGNVIDTVTLHPAYEPETDTNILGDLEAEKLLLSNEELDKFQLANAEDTEMPQEIADKFAWTSEDFYHRLQDRVNWTQFLKAPYEYTELWEARYNRHDQIDEEDFYHTGLLHIFRIVEMWGRGMSPQVALLSVLQVMSRGEMTDILADLVNLQVTMHENDLEGMCCDLSTLQGTLDTIQTEWRETLSLEPEGGDNNVTGG